LQIKEQNNRKIAKQMKVDYYRKLAGILSTNGRLTKALLEDRKIEREKNGAAKCKTKAQE